MHERKFTITFKCENEDWLPSLYEIERTIENSGIIDESCKWDDYDNLYSVEKGSKIQQYEREIKLLKLEIEDLKSKKVIDKNYGDINIS